MMTVREILPQDLDAFLDIVANAYPGINLHPPEEKQKMKERMLKARAEDTHSRLWGVYRDEALLGGMRLFDFRQNLFGIKVDAGGVGLVAVDLLRKKEHVARELISWFLRHYRERGAPMALLYPFRPDFYKQMGFGYGQTLQQYRLDPRGLPRAGSKAHIRYATAADAAALLACYSRYADRTHGMIERSPLFFPQVLENPENRVVAMARDGAIHGYLIFSFKPVEPDNFLLNDLQISELVHENTDALRELLTFLATQADQVNRIVLNTQDPSFYFLLRDPRNGSGHVVTLYHESSTQGVGLMYRVIDVPGIFAALRDHSWGGQSVRLRLTLSDSFLPENAGSTIIVFEDGRARIAADAAHDVELRLDVAEFSSLLVGAVPFKRLLSYGLAELSDPAYTETIHRLFLTDERPICLTRF